MKLSIKMRVTLMCTLMTALIASLALYALLAGAERIQWAYYRNFLISTAELAYDNVIYDEDGALEIDRNLDDMPGVRVALFTTEGDLIYGRRWLEDLPLQSGEIRSTRGRRGNEWFVYDSLLEYDSGDDIYLRCICSADAVRGIHLDSTQLAWLLIPSLILLAGAGGYAIARRAFRPVVQIVRTAEGIADGKDLKKRIALTGAKDELYDLARAFDDMFERLDGAFERERQFTSDVSHELRTPVTSILTQSEFALSDAADDADRREALLQIHAKASAMAELTRRLLTLSRIDAGQLPLSIEVVDLSILAEVAAESIADAAAEKGMSIDISRCASAEMQGDQTMLMQAALNLLENAVRYGKTNGTITLETGHAEGKIFLSVHDDGDGIPSEALPHIFERFYQADAARHNPGAGLGLSLVQRIAQLHGGRAIAESASGEGAKFTLKFPA